jgi:transposase InsO family protein
MVSRVRWRAAVAHLMHRFAVSERRACQLVGQHRFTQRYVIQPPEFELRLVARLNELAERHPRYGYRRIWALLRQEGWLVNRKRIERLWRPVADMTNPYRMAAIQGRIVEVRPDEGCGYMDPISIKYTGAPFPSRGPDRVCFVIAVEQAAQRTLGFVHSPG